MKYKSYIKYFLIFSIILISLLPVYNFYQYAKEFDFKKSFNIDDIEKYKNYLVYKLFNRSLIPDKVIAGKDNFLFLGSSHDSILYKTIGIYRPSDIEIKNWIMKLKDLQKWYEDRGIKFAIVIAPNKQSIYKDKLPYWMNYNGENITDDIIKQANISNINILDLRSLLINHSKKNNELLYYKTDSHWNNLGASIGYSETINYINNKFGTNYRKPDYSVSQQFRSSGDLSNFLKINSILGDKYEIDYKLNFKNNVDVCHGNIDYSNGILGKCNMELNPRMEINAQAQYMINDKVNSGKLLLLCDSFGSAHSELYNLTFNTIWKFHHGGINGENLANFVDENNPDIVVYQIVERALYNENIVASFPKIRKLFTTNINPANLIFDITKNSFFKNDQFKINIDKEDIKLDVLNNDPIIILDQIKSNNKNVILNYEINSKIDTTFQIFYKKDKKLNYNEADSYVVTLLKGNNKINLLVSSEYVNNILRIDLVSNIGNFEIKEFKIYDDTN